MNTKLALLLIPVLAACTSTGSSVVPLKASASVYENWTCQQLADEQMRLSIATMVGSPETEVSNSIDQQRKYDALTRALNSQECGAPKPIVARAG